MGRPQFGGHMTMMFTPQKRVSAGHDYIGVVLVVDALQFYCIYKQPLLLLLLLHIFSQVNSLERNRIEVERKDTGAKMN